MIPRPRFVLLGALTAAALFTPGCMSVNVNLTLPASQTSALSPSAQSPLPPITITVTQTKPVTASPYLTTTGDDIGKAVNAALGGVNLQDLKGAISELRSSIRQQ